MNKEEFLKLSDLDKVKYAIEESLKEHKDYKSEYWKGSAFMGNNILQTIEQVKKLTMPVVKHRFSIDDPIIVKASLDIRSEHVCSNPLIKPEQTDRQLKGYLVELLNSLNGA